MLIAGAKRRWLSDAAADKGRAAIAAVLNDARCPTTTYASEMLSRALAEVDRFRDREARLVRAIAGVEESTARRVVAAWMEATGQRPPKTQLEAVAETAAAMGGAHHPHNLRAAAAALRSEEN